MSFNGLDLIASGQHGPLPRKALSPWKRFQRAVLVGLSRAFLVAMAAGIGARAAAAQTPFGFLFGSPPRQRTYRPRRVRPPAPASVAVIPLPIPRPRFPGDPPTAVHPATTVKAPEDVVPPPGERTKTPQPRQAAEPEATKPVETSKPSGPDIAHANEPTGKPVESSPAVPEPPPKPPDLTKLQTTKPETSNPEPTKPGLPGPPAPAVGPSGATTNFAPRAPDDDPACPGRLKARGVAAEPTAIDPQPDARCSVVEPVRLTGLTLPDGGTVDFPDRPTVACTTADAFSLYVRDLLVPLAKGTFGSPISAVSTGPGLECRPRDHIFGAKLSAHGQGLAIDIAELALADKRTIAVGSPKTEQETGFETASRAGACGYFHTVLGPGSDAYHRTHWHFDLEVRGAKGDSKYCK